jgi:hypothetical protein
MRLRLGRTLLPTLLGVLLAQGAAAGNLTVEYKVGNTALRVDGEHLTSGDDVSDTLMHMGIGVTYKWDQGPFLEFGLATSFDPMPLFEWNNLDQATLAGGWQFGDENWVFKPKVGITRTSLKSQEEDFFEGDEPVDEIRKVVPFLEGAVEYRFWGKLGVGAYVRRNFEDFGASTLYGMSFGWTFD